MSTGQRMLQGSRSLPQPFSSFPELKPESTIPNTIFNKLIETVQKLGGGFAESSCKWKNPNNRGNTNKPLGLHFLDELSKVIRSIAGNLQKFRHFPPELTWAQDTWKKNGQNPKPNKLRLQPDSHQHWGLLNSVKILKTLLQSAWLNHERWEGTRALLKKLLQSIMKKVDELQQCQVRSSRSKQLLSSNINYTTQGVLLKRTSTSMCPISEKIWNPLQQMELLQPLDISEFISNGPNKWQRATSLKFPETVCLQAFPMGGRRGDVYFATRIPEGLSVDQIAAEKGKEVLSTSTLNSQLENNLFIFLIFSFRRTE